MKANTNGVMIAKKIEIKPSKSWIMLCRAMTTKPNQGTYCRKNRNDHEHVTLRLI